MAKPQLDFMERLLGQAIYGTRVTCAKVTWTRYERTMGGRRTGYADYEACDADGRQLDVVVHWCGHPTALYRYAVIVPDGELIGTYRTVAKAKAAAELWLREGFAGIEAERQRFRDMGF